MDSTPPTLSPTSQIELVRLPRRPNDRWPLVSPYVDRVWSEVLGVTAVAVARRQPTASPSKRRPLRVTPSKTLNTLRRLHHHGLVDFREHTAVLGITRLAPDVPAALASQLSPNTARLLAMLAVREPPPGRGPGGIGASRAGTLER